MATRCKNIANRMCKNKKPTLIRVVTVPISFRFLLRDQLRFMSEHFDVVGVSSPGPLLNDVHLEEGIRVVPLQMSRKITPFSDIVSLLRMIRLFLKEKPLIVHSHTPKAGLIAMLAANITRVPYRIHTVAGMPLQVSTGIKRRILEWIEKLTYFCATHIISNSKGLDLFLINNLGLSPKKRHFIDPGSSNGIALDHYCRTDVIEKKALALRSKFNLNDTFVYLFAGRIVKDKGIDEMTEAFVKLHADFPHCRWLICGDFDQGLNQVSQSTKHHLTTHPAIHCAGFMSDIRIALCAADALVLPSYREGLPQILLQACAMDLPCITTDIIGCNEVIRSQVNGLIIPPQNADALHDAMKHLLCNRDLYEQLRKQARASVQEYDQKKIWNKLLAIYLSR